MALGSTDEISVVTGSESLPSVAGPQPFATVGCSLTGFLSSASVSTPASSFVTKSAKDLLASFATERLEQLDASVALSELHRKDHSCLEKVGS